MLWVAGHTIGMLGHVGDFPFPVGFICLFVTAKHGKYIVFAQIIGFQRIAEALIKLPHFPQGVKALICRRLGNIPQNEYHVLVVPREAVLHIRIKQVRAFLPALIHPHKRGNHSGHLAAHGKSLGKT